MNKAIFIGKVAQAGGVSVQTVRYYERMSLLPPSQRTPSRYRAYGPETLDRLRFIKRAQALGFSLEEVREILRLRYEGRSPCKCVRQLLERKLEQLEREMAELARFRHELRATLKGSQKLPRLPHSASPICPIIESAQYRQKTGKIENF